MPTRPAARPIGARRAVAGGEETGAPAPSAAGGRIVAEVVRLPLPERRPHTLLPPRPASDAPEAPSNVGRAHRARGRVPAPVARWPGRPPHDAPPPSSAGHAGPRLASVALLFLWMVWLLLTPFYAFRSGLPQPATGAMALIVLVVVLSGNDRVPRYIDLLASGVGFVAYTALVNWAWWLFHPDLAFLLSSAYYLYNFLALAVVLVLYRELGDGFVPATKLCLLLALAIEIAALTFFADPAATRITGTFNNPNQLGYWALLVAACLLVLKADRRLTATDVAALAAAGYVAILSGSRAAMLAFALLAALGAVCQGLRGRTALGLALAACVAWAAVALPTMKPPLIGGERSLLAGAALELETIGARASDSLEGRGYDRIWNHPEHLLLGAGEGAYDRFATRVLDKELHSLFGTLLFSYGMVGLVLFCGIMAAVFRRAATRCWLYALPVMFYGLTHQGLRFTLFWVFLALVLSVGHRRREGPAPVARRAAATVAPWGLTAGVGLRR